MKIWCLFGVSLVVGAQQCSDVSCSTVKLQDGIDFLNQDSQKSVAATSVADCCALCQKDAACFAFTFRKDQQSCYLKADGANPQTNKQAVSGLCGSKPTPPACVGEFMPCKHNGQGVCSMSGECGTCKHGEYLCPSDQTTCVSGPEDYKSCPGLKGTHFDDSLDIEARIDYILKHTTTDEKIKQLWNSAPAIDHLGIPEFEWLNDE
jgi:hypothetical protein